jgi:hypothetical protein
MRWKKALAAIVIVAPVFTGYVAGSVLSARACSAYIGAALCAGLALAAFGLFAPTPEHQQAAPERVSALALLGYVGLLLLVERDSTFSPLDVRNGPGVLWSLAWLAPLIVGAAVAPHRPFERARWPWWLLAFAATAIVSCDTANLLVSVGFTYIARD